MNAVTKTTKNDNAPAKTVAANVGINVNPTGAGVFGFSNFAETWNGRMAMIGLVAGFANEVITGKGILAQVGITGASSILFALFFAGFTIATLLGYYTVKVTKDA